MLRGWTEGRGWMKSILEMMSDETGQGEHRILERVVAISTNGRQLTVSVRGISLSSSVSQGLQRATSLSLSSSTHELLQVPS